MHVNFCYSNQNCFRKIYANLKSKMLKRRECLGHVFIVKVLNISGNIYTAKDLPFLWCSKYTCIGFYLTNDLRWSKHITLMCSMARRKLGYIYRRFYKFSHDSSTLLILFKAFVWPILEYGAHVWDPHFTKDIQAIESDQRFATKICLKNWSMPYSDRLKLLDL